MKTLMLVMFLALISSTVCFADDDDRINLAPLQNLANAWSQPMPVYRPFADHQVPNQQWGGQQVPQQPQVRCFTSYNYNQWTGRSEPTTVCQ